MNKKIVLIDMDGVLADFRESFVKESLKNDFEIDSTDKGIYIKIKEDRDNKKRNFINSQKGFYLGLPPITGAIQAVKEMSIDDNFEVFFCSTPSEFYQNCVLEKYQWIEKHFGFEMTKKIILTRDKTLIKGDYLIDDKPYVDGIIDPQWEQVYFSQPYNKDCRGKHIDDWTKWREVIK
jgi:5'-nucleotidase